MCKATGRIAGLAGGLVAAACLSTTGIANAAGLTINGMPASTAAARVGQAYAANIELGPGVNGNQPVSFNVADASNADGRTSAVTYLAHQLNAERRTILVVSKSNGSAWKAPGSLDTSTLVTFTSRRLPATAVLHQIAYVDNAGLRYATPVHGFVTLSSLSMPARQAAVEVAEQTHTTLAVTYVLRSRISPMASSTPGTIIGYTAGGQPIKSDIVVTGRKRTASTNRYAHRRGSISITSSVPPTLSTDTNPNPPIAGSPPATVIGPQTETPQMYSLPSNNLSLGTPYWVNTNPSPYNTGYWPYSYGFGNGLTVLPSTDIGPTVVIR